MRSLFTLLLIILVNPNLNAINLQKAKIYTTQHNIKGWMMSEKLDGIRAYWDGKKLLSKNGNTIHAPLWVYKRFSKV